MKIDSHKFETMAGMYYYLEAEAGATKMALVRPFLDEFGDFLEMIRPLPEFEVIRTMNIEEFLTYFKIVLEEDKNARHRDRGFGRRKKRTVILTSPEGKVKGKFSPDDKRLAVWRKAIESGRYPGWKLE